MKRQETSNNINHHSHGKLGGLSRWTIETWKYHFCVAVGPWCLANGDKIGSAIWRSALTVCFFPFGSMMFFVRFQWASSYIIISMSCFFFVMQNWYTMQYVLGYFGCVGMLIIMNYQFVLITSLHLSNGVPRCWQAWQKKVPRVPWGPVGWTNGNTWAQNGKRGLPSENEIQWISLAGDLLCRKYCASPPSNSFKELWNNLVSISTFPVPDTVGHCWFLWQGVFQDLRCLLIHFCGIVCMIYKEVLTDINNVLICIHSDSYCIHTAFIFHPA